jgi:hypothetical protein
MLCLPPRRMFASTSACIAKVLSSLLAALVVLDIKRLIDASYLGLEEVWRRGSECIEDAIGPALCVSMIGAALQAATLPHS